MLQARGAGGTPGPLRIGDPDASEEREADTAARHGLASPGGQRRAGPAPRTPTAPVLPALRRFGNPEHVEIAARNWTHFSPAPVGTTSRDRYIDYHTRAIRATYYAGASPLTVQPYFPRRSRGSECTSSPTRSRPATSARPDPSCAATGTRLRWQIPRGQRVAVLHACAAGRPVRADRAGVRGEHLPAQQRQPLHVATRLEGAGTMPVSTGWSTLSLRVA